MTLETLKSRLEKREAEAKDLKRQIKEAESAQKQAEEFVAKLQTLSPQISDAIQAVLNQAQITLPEGKEIITVVGKTGLLTNIVNGKAIKTRKGNGGAKAIIFEGEEMSWAKLCEIKNIARTPGGSAHRDVYNKAKDLHDSIQHECSIDGKTY